MNRQFFDDYCSEKVVVMPKPRFIEEHKKLLQVLERKDPQELEKEKKEQEKELKSYLKKGKKK
jgi:hypothetical protein